jgi:hypothetical protein
MPSTVQAAKTIAFDRVWTTPFTRIHGRPSRSNYEILKQEAATIASKAKDLTYDWNHDTATGNKYGLIAEILGVNEYNHQTGISTYIKEIDPDSYDPTIDDTTPTHTQKCKEEEWECMQTCWYICKGFLKGATANLCDAINEQFYSQLKYPHTTYHNTTPFQNLNHLNSTWCPLDFQAKKKLKEAYLSKWDSHEHLTTFRKHLNDDQTSLVQSDITISDKDKLLFYLEQIYNSNIFDKAKMMEWEQKPSTIKTDYTRAKDHFEARVKANHRYIQNSSGTTAGCNNYDSTINMANIGDKIKDYIAKIAIASITNNDVIANMCKANKSKDAKLTAMAAQIKQLIAAIAKLLTTNKPNNKNVDPNRNQGCRTIKQITKLQNMGAYCHTHGFHPVGPTHESATCQYKKEDSHQDAATWSNRLNGATYWPLPIRVSIQQKGHASWKDKSKPNWQGPGMTNETDNTNNVAFSKIKQSLASNFYSILSPLPCQVEEQAATDSNITIKQRKGDITFRLPANYCNNNKIATRWARCIENRRNSKANQAALHSFIKTTYRLATDQLAAITDNRNQCMYLHDDKELRQGILNQSIPSAVVGSGATSSVGTPTDPFLSTGQQSDKIFCLPNGATEASSKIGKLATNVRALVRNIHITPGIAK